MSLLAMVMVHANLRPGLAAQEIDTRLKELSLQLPPPVGSAGSYVPWVRYGNIVVISGQGPVLPGGKLSPDYQGTVGRDVSLEVARDAARIAAINTLSHLKTACDGDLDKVKKIIRLMGFVRSVPDFPYLPKVLDGASDLLVDVFGEKGKHARYVAGVSALPFNFVVTLELMVELQA